MGNAVNTNATGYWYGPGQTWLSGIEEKKFGVDLVWETSTKYNAGLDIGLFNKFSFSLTHSKSVGKYFVEKGTVACTYWIGSPWTPYGNVGIVDNKGFDAAIELKTAQVMD